MNKKKRIDIIVAMVLIAATVCFWPLSKRLAEQSRTGSTIVETHPVPGTSMGWRTATATTSTPTSSPNPPAPSDAAMVEKRTNQMRTEIESGSEEWRTAIEFYGKVVDENTNPVENASVHFTWTDLSPKGNSEKDTTSDLAGRFSLKNANGKNLIVQVSKEGYHSYPRFGAAFNYAGENQNFLPDAANPVIFRLKKKGVAEPLVHIRSPLGGPKGFRIAKDGTVEEISLTSGKVVPPGQGDLRVQCWTDNQGKLPGERYHWKCQISVPGGGILQSTNALDFNAPQGGYQTEDMIDMRANLENWSSHASRNYFVRLANGNYARISFEMVAGGDHFFQLESFLNPTGSRNLEPGEPGAAGSKPPPE